jgi:hypothetical protein
MKTWTVKPQGIPVTFKFYGRTESVNSFCQGLSLSLDCEVTFRRRTHRGGAGSHGKMLGGTGITDLNLNDLKYCYGSL